MSDTATSKAQTILTIVAASVLVAMATGLTSREPTQAAPGPHAAKPIVRSLIPAMQLRGITKP